MGHMLFHELLKAMEPSCIVQETNLMVGGATAFAACPSKDVEI
jgi:hypothetical protein